MVATIDFGPCFLENEYPDLVDVTLALRWLGKGPFAALFVIREVVIDDHSAALAIDINLNGVTACIVDLLSQKDPLDTIGILREGR